MSITQLEANGSMEYQVPVSPTTQDLLCLEKVCFSKAKANGGTDTPDKVS